MASTASDLLRIEMHAGDHVCALCSGGRARDELVLSRFSQFSSVKMLDFWIDSVNGALGDRQFDGARVTGECLVER